ncbi:YebC/PmpR family DNA-binding transcriptional regulator [Mycoplasma zalophi]|uniref:Probable transcriptional regulatory protein KQ875_01620 n=1 Tax=Mycoplasma zalophi TaxID=191287 RepID=A0ABS6DPW1_9MOLU|nr:YebC/PmpR family DNA-binding transcriptional regulator [Mycoplasma zalophi]MBU4690904.1 YebC/PmpR family DNA-binding transcriptional regulator [Mycoplasma zalophi]MBU4692293.1 YebC/PmpR family DNA-binding transcriptional regulator [Mycoplasma zalophi]
MSGHSKWATTKHHKAAMDAARSKIFQKFSKEIMVAASLGGPDPDANPALRLAIAKAKARSMPKANIEKAVQKGSGTSKEGADFKSYLYTATAFGGTNFIVTCLTDNFNRLASNIQYYFNKVNGQMGKGTIPYTFDERGVLAIKKEDLKNDWDDVLMIAMDNGAVDFKEDEEEYTIYSEPSSFTELKKALETEANIENFSIAEISYIPNTEVVISGDKIEKFENFLDLLEDDDDIQEVYHNAVFDEE